METFLSENYKGNVREGISEPIETSNFKGKYAHKL